MARSFFTPVIFAAGTTASPSLRLGNGVAPSSPTTGDVWFDGLIRVRTSGGTSTVAYTDIAQTFLANIDFGTAAVSYTINATDLRAVSVVMGAY